MKKRLFITGLVVVIIFAAWGNFTCATAESTGKKQNVSKKVIQITGKVIEDSSGNKNGIMTIKSKKNKVNIFYEFGKFKITGANIFQQGDLVTASYKPVKADYDGELVSIIIQTKK